MACQPALSAICTDDPDRHRCPTATLFPSGFLNTCCQPISKSEGGGVKYYGFPGNLFASSIHRTRIQFHILPVATERILKRRVRKRNRRQLCADLNQDCHNVLHYNEIKLNLNERTSSKYVTLFLSPSITLPCARDNAIMAYHIR